jgi:hypothetical protein
MAGNMPASSGFNVWRTPDAAHACAVRSGGEGAMRTLCGHGLLPGATAAPPGEARITCETCLEKLAAAW